jgi:two-component system, chemotaxis family, chemotaxis protein CheY
MALGLKNIIEAEDGDETKTPNDDEFNLVISDMEMPKMSGLELLRAVRKNKILKDIPFIMATTVTAKDIIIEVMRLGVQAYIIKSFDEGTVAFKLKHAGII